MTQTPERTKGTMCRQMVEKGHVGYQCTLPQGHEDNFAEPHYAIEVDHAARAWGKWYDQRTAAAQPVMAPEVSLRYEENFADELAVLNAKAGVAGLYAPVPMDAVNAAHMESMGLGDVKLGEPIEPPETNSIHDRCESIYQGVGVFFRCVLKIGHLTDHIRGSARWPYRPDEKAPFAVIEPTKQRDGDQPLPVVNDHQDIQTRVIEDIKARREVGIKRYGTALQPHNGRDSLQDAYEEAMDLTMYLKQMLVERSEERFV